MFGDWINNTENLKNEYLKNTPFENVVIHNFFKEDIINKLIDNFPEINNDWYKYWNPIEKKYAFNKLEKTPLFLDLFSELQNENFVKKISEITGITNLENDPHLHGAGIHFHPPGGKLDMHLDYSIHPISKKERRVNLIIYLNKEWKEEYNGDLQLWNSDFTKPVKNYYPSFNTAVLFKTSDISYHGLPSLIKCPDGMGRKSLAIYYVSDSQEKASHRFKAEYRSLPWQPVNDKLKKLYEIRKTRIITDEDLKNIYPNWENEGNEFW
jgi:Rps23 Pro-64 3,4-dihydroxylase Tpa1-like proline 4-hydroxylase